MHQINLKWKNKYFILSIVIIVYGLSVDGWGGFSFLHRKKGNQKTQLKHHVKLNTMASLVQERFEGA